MESLALQFGRGLYRLRVAKGLARSQVVAHNDLSLNALSSIENGASLVKLDTLMMLLNYYGEDFAAFTQTYLAAPAHSGRPGRWRDQAEPRFFVLDTKGAVTANRYADQDFEAYSWNAHQYNRVREGDWFIYRRPQSASETRQWYLFGAGQIGRITESPDGGRHAALVHATPFARYLLAKPDLEVFAWTFKAKTRADWNNFFNMYGMTEINQADFEGLLALSETSTDAMMIGEAETAYRQISQGQYAVTDKQALATQRIGQSVLAERVKADYGYSCAVSGIHTREFLVASHIVPWREDRARRLDPGNVICLSSLWDRAFDQGFVTFGAKDKRIILARAVHDDQRLEAALAPYAGQQLHMPAHFLPEQAALEYHNDAVFLG